MLTDSHAFDRQVRDIIQLALLALEAAIDTPRVADRVLARTGTSLHGTANALIAWLDAE